ncbi:hypothetical protein KHA90_05800 [Flavobacterium psychroterrae]|uniref:DUF4468 domain-containing protein n=1 Tax=Flavobacterium psychroterrae TaxID=2133767 RepID=A0ABS5P9J7_9FLAO|nr:hypothetical protein [Flavobacterium psychroterrae]MBS7230530.1 hypothetical protein [Flavobacterium psychroterrae]
MRAIKIILFFFFCFSNSFAQPGIKEHTTLNIQDMYINGRQIFKKGDASIQNNMIYLKNKKGEKDVWTKTVSEIGSEFDCFIYKKDTMRVKIILPKYYRLEYIRIKKFHFVKGNFSIDLLEYIKKNRKNGCFIINNFPEDCIAYKKEEDKN